MYEHKSMNATRGRTNRPATQMSVERPMLERQSNILLVYLGIRGLTLGTRRMQYAEQEREYLSLPFFHDILFQSLCSRENVSGLCQRRQHLRRGRPAAINKPPKSYPNNISPTKNNNNVTSFCIKWKLGKKNPCYSRFPFDAKTYHVVISNQKKKKNLIIAWFYHSPLLHSG